jgi:Pyridoxamine 5'-phosphate oxidase
MLMASWGEFEAQAPVLAAFGAERLTAAAAYLATLRLNGRPRVHPVAPIVGGGRLFVFMEPTSPKAHDLGERDWYALHNGVPDTFGTGGEFFVSGRASLVDDPQLRNVASEAASYQPEDRYVLFELGINEARCNGYGDIALPVPGHWMASDP